MGLVGHEEVEVVSEPVQVQISALVGGDGDRLEIVLSIPIRAHLGRIELADRLHPLVKELPGGDNYEGGRFEDQHGPEGEPGLAAPGGQADESPPAGRRPGMERLGLVRTQLRQAIPRDGRWLEALRAFRTALAGDATSSQPLEEVRQAIRLRAQAAYSRIPDEVIGEGEGSRSCRRPL